MPTRLKIFPPRRKMRPLPDDADSFALNGLHWMAAGLALATGADVAAGHGTRLQGERARNALAVARWTPLLVGMAAGAAQAMTAVRPGARSRSVARALNGAIIGTAAVATALGAYEAIRSEEPTVGWRGGRRDRAQNWLSLAAPLAFGATGLLGLILEREEREEFATHRRLERRASIIDRLIPGSKSRIDRLVIRA